MSSPDVHPSAVIGKNVDLAPGVVVGPCCVVMDHAALGPDTRLVAQTTVGEHTRMGARNTVFPGAFVGGPPQDLKYAGGATSLEVGDDNVIRESVTINRGTETGGGATRIGNGCLLMACCHIAHDCQIEDNVIMGNNVLLAGHIHIASRAYICGGAAMHHFSSVGELAYVGGLTRIVHDVPPFLVVEGNPAEVRGVNAIGMKRAGHSPEAIKALKDAFRTIYRSDLTRVEACEKLEGDAPLPAEVVALLDFLARSDQGKQGRYRECLR